MGTWYIETLQSCFPLLLLASSLQTPFKLVFWPSFTRLFLGSEHPTLGTEKRCEATEVAAQGT